MLYIFANMNSLTYNSQLLVQSTHKPYIVLFFHNYLWVILAIITFTFKLGKKIKNKTNRNYVVYYKFFVFKSQKLTQAN